MLHESKKFWVNFIISTNKKSNFKTSTGFGDFPKQHCHVIKCGPRVFWKTCIAEITLLLPNLNERQTPLPPTLFFSLSLPLQLSLSLFKNLSNSLQKNPPEKPTGKEKTIPKIIFSLSTPPHPGNQFLVKSFQSKP